MPPPPFLDPKMSGTMQSYTHTLSPPHHCARSQPGGRKRHDSLLLNVPTSWTPTDVSGNSIKAKNGDVGHFMHDASDAPSSATLRPARPATLQKQNSFRFLVTTNPTQFKNKTVMRENRKHVMNDFLRKERRKTPGTRDIRAEGPAEVQKRRRLGSDGREAMRPKNLAAPGRLLETGVLTPQSSNDGTSDSVLYGSDAAWAVTTLASRTASHRGTESTMTLIPRSIADDMEDDEHPICTSGGDETDLHPSSCSCHWSEQEGLGLSVPDLFSVLGFKVSPYHTWLQSANTAVDLEKMKYACGRRLRSCSMAKLWLPNLIRARHSFLSTICISAAHDEAMQRVVFGSESLSLRGSKRAVVYERLAVKSEVISMINASLDDPDQMISDATIIAVMNIFNSEIIGCDAGALEVHQKGLNKMISMRGGLDKLGVVGHLARTLCITMLVGMETRLLHVVAHGLLTLFSMFRPRFLTIAQVLEAFALYRTDLDLTERRTARECSRRHVSALRRFEGCAATIGWHPVSRVADILWTRLRNRD
jgi:hypothetical protein